MKTFYCPNCGRRLDYLVGSSMVIEESFAGDRATNYEQRCDCGKAIIITDYHAKQLKNQDMIKIVLD